MSNDVNTAYLKFLETQVGAEPNNRSYRDLLKLMLAKEFVWLVPNDDNRLVDGLDIRAEWSDMDFGPCSFLEVLVGLSRRMAFMTSESAEGWGWQFLINLGLDRMSDPLSRYKTQKANDILDTVIWRNYSIDGFGGFFPLLRPKKDQRETELWYQMSAYVLEIQP